jgi:preprotein translocase subunit SecB
MFTYSETYQEEEVRLFLEQGSLSILLPFARELLFSICARLQVPPMMLTMVQLAPHPSIHKPSHEEDLSNK